MYATIHQYQLRAAPRQRGRGRLAPWIRPGAQPRLRRGGGQRWRALHDRTVRRSGQPDRCHPPHWADATELAAGEVASMLNNTTVYVHRSFAAGADAARLVPAKGDTISAEFAPNRPVRRRRAARSQPPARRRPGASDTTRHAPLSVADGNSRTECRTSPIRPRAGWQNNRCRPAAKHRLSSARGDRIAKRARQFRHSRRSSPLPGDPRPA